MVLTCFLCFAKIRKNSVIMAFFLKKIVDYFFTGIESEYFL